MYIHNIILKMYINRHSIILEGFCVLFLIKLLWIKNSSICKYKINHNVELKADILWFLHFGAKMACGSACDMVIKVNEIQCPKLIQSNWYQMKCKAK